tara:strand:- start:22450 stop:22632 length:183 start_codon:yes stop_codon:yes gene_type:complete
MLTQDKISDALCDMYDIRRQARVSGFNLLPKDPDGSIFVIGDCISNVIYILETLEENNND